ncbi:MAG: DUF58 domain-containing protein, partial [Bdellovibrionales bacterium]|nr:DUF58 domain-containing protein [Bdellovibrionales bacterium]
LSGLKLESVQFPFLHEEENGHVDFHFSSTNAQGHYFIRPYFKSNILKISDKKITFAISDAKKMIMNLPITASKRGHESIKSIYIETLFPFNFFRCFTYFRVDRDVMVYPKRVNLNLHEEVELTELSKEDDGEDFFIRNYQLGDSLKRVDWKKLAQTNQWYTRQFQSAKPNPILLILDKTPVEETLQSICFSMHGFHQQNIKYGIKLKNKVMISPSNSPLHLEQCLRELAYYEN